MATITDGFTFTIPSSTMDILAELSNSIGIFPYEKMTSPIFDKGNPRVPTVNLTHFNSTFNNEIVHSYKNLNNNKGKKETYIQKSGNRRHPYSHKPNNSLTQHTNGDNKFSHLRAKFVATKFDKKSELKTQMDEIRVMLNKLTEKNYLDMTQSIIKSLDKIQDSFEESSDALEQVGNMIFDIASTNRFYSQTYAELYSELIVYNQIFRNIFMKTFDVFIDLFRDVKCVDSTINYDEFCKNEKLNERRRSLGAFFINLMKNRIITESNILQIMQILSIQLHKFYLYADKKPEVDELISTLAIMYDKTWMDLCKNNGDYCIEVDNTNMTIVEFVYFLSKCKRNDFPGLTSKSIFKCMDLVSVVKK